MLERMIVEIMQEVNIPGMSIGIITNGEVVYKRGFGARDLDTNLPMTPNTLFGIGSISKMFTALAINQLVDQSKLSLQDPISKFINFKLGTRKDPITIHHFLTHSSGINAIEGNFVAAERLLGVSNSFVPMSGSEDLLTFINGATTEIFDKPGSVYIYNNDMYDCLGLVIEKVAGMKFIDYIQKNILKPLGMKRTTYSMEDYKRDDDISRGYLFGENGKMISKDPPIADLQAPAGGMLSCVNELLNYMIAFMNKGNFNGTQIIESSTIERLWTPFIKTDEKGKEYGYGWMIEKDFFGNRLVCHSGNLFISSGYLAIIPELKMGLVIGQNCAHFSPEIIGRAILALLLGIDIKEAVPLLDIQKKLNHLIGHYETYKGVMKLDVSLDNGILVGKIKYPGSSNIISFPVVIENMKDMKFFIPFAIPELEMKGQVFINENTGKVDLKVSNWVFHKI
jgi:CubicO group peptidase (beta-lactamase class C family)